MEQLDRSIPFYNTILRFDRYEGTEIRLPQGFSFRTFQEGDEQAWARLEHEIGDFSSREEAERYFMDTYLGNPAELAKRCVFVVDENGEIAGSCIAWRDSKGTGSVASLHWLIVHPDEQGKGLGRALCEKTMQRFHDLQEFPVYIHTQPWSWKAILLYISVGFRLQRTDSFSHYENQYTQAMETLNGILNRQQYDLLVQTSDE